MMLFSRRRSMFLLVSFLSSTLVTVAAGPSAKYRWRLLPLSVPSLEASDLPEIAAGEGVVAVIASPDTPSAFVAGGGEIDVSGNNALSLQRLSDNDDAPMVLVCRGATLSDGDSDADDDSTSTCLSVTSLVADSIIVDGLTEGDVEAGLESSRHARTLTAIFRSRVLLMDTHDSNGDPLAPQTLVLCASSSSSGEEEEVASQHVAAMEKQVEDLYQAVAAQSPTALSFKSRYKLRTVFCPTASDAQQVSTNKKRQEKRRSFIFKNKNALRFCFVPCLILFGLGWCGVVIMFPLLCFCNAWWKAPLASMHSQCFENPLDRNTSADTIHN